MVMSQNCEAKTRWGKDEILSLLAVAAFAAGPGIPLIVSSWFYMDMRWHILGEMEIEARPEYLKAAVFARWRGRWIFLFPNKSVGVPADEGRHGPEAYPEGLAVIEGLERNSRKTGETQPSVCVEGGSI